MSQRPSHSHWQFSRAVATLVLHDRAKRRDFMTKLLVALVTLFALGLWPLDSWLMRSAWRFVGYWGGTGFLAFFLTLLTFYDVLAVIREERGTFLDENGPLTKEDLDRLVREAKAEMKEEE